jgi:hypothetical protein
MYITGTLVSSKALIADIPTVVLILIGSVCPANAEVTSRKRTMLMKNLSRLDTLKMVY